jgi:hypothetical protein
MPRVVPSDVVAAIDRLFPEMAKNAHADPNVGFDQVASVLVVARLVDSVPTDLLILDRLAELPWGTPSYKVSDEVSAKRLCVFVRETPEVATCSRYTLPGIGSGVVSFYSLAAVDTEPADGKLAGYRIALVGDHERMKQVVTERFGPPVLRKRGTSEGLVDMFLDVVAWEWSNVTAVLSKSCDKGNVCLTVRTREFAAHQAQREEEKRRSDFEKAKKSF